MVYFLIFLSFLVAAPSVLANESYAYQPPGCDFQATFPTKPDLKRRCPSDPNQDCFQVAQFTKIFAANATISVELSCTPVSQDMLIKYDQDVMANVLKGLLRQQNLSSMPEIVYREDDHSRIVAASAMKRSGFTDKIFVAQLWAGEQSIMTLEAEAGGVEYKQADQMFADILRSIRHQENKAEDNKENSGQTEDASE
jgi:hypothetical protein